MTTPIDLDLVELRAKLRGWTVLARGREKIDIHTPAGSAELCSWGEIDCDEHTLAEHIPTLTAPRWTLERLLSVPPEGWRVAKAGIGRALKWGGPWLWGDDEWEDYEVACSVVVLPDPARILLRTTVAPASGPEGLARLAERHKAAAELALILAEVEP